MFKKRPCPWCRENLSLSMPGLRRVPHKRIPGLDERRETVCPYCNRAIARDKKSSRWLILVIPFAYVFLWRAWTMGLPWQKWLLNFSTAEISLIGLATVGAVMQGLTWHWVKDE